MRLTISEVSRWDPRMCEIYERLTAHGIITVRVANHLAPHLG